ncbi:hypothetical protein QYM36_009854, partial [Artemia franciscana]
MARGQKGVSDENQNELYILGHMTKGGSGSNSPKQTGKVPEVAKGYVAKKLSVLPKARGIKEGYAADKAHYQGYQSFRWDRKSGKGGGLLTLVSERYTAEEKKIVAYGFLEFGVVKVTNIKGRAINIVNYYNNRTGNFSKSHFRKILKETEYLKIIIGDFNLHDTIWNDSHTEDGKAKELIGILFDTEEQIALATPKNLATRLNKTTRVKTTLDLTIISTELSADLTFYSEDDFDSDHFIIFTDMDDAKQCLKRGVIDNSHSWVVFVGDSRIRQLFTSLVSHIDNKYEEENIELLIYGKNNSSAMHPAKETRRSALTKPHADLLYDNKDLRTTLEFKWVPVLNDSFTEICKHLK